MPPCIQHAIVKLKPCANECAGTGKIPQITQAMAISRDLSLSLSLSCQLSLEGYIASCKHNPTSQRVGKELTFVSDWDSKP
jgi:hypothetical protein